MATRRAPRQEEQRPLLIPVLLFSGAVVLGLIAAAMFVFNSAAESGGIGPQLAVSQEQIDFGKQPFDKMVRAEFRLENAGDRTLTIDTSTPIRVLQGC